MFTLDEINSAHSKVKSGSDFPAYIQNLIKLGVSSYVTFVTDGHTDYFGANAHFATSPAKYETLAIAARSNASQFTSDLKAHQAGNTDYPTFCEDCAKSGIEKWVALLDEMTCTYFDKAGKEILVEVIPG
ncbi:hypothetical protein GCM10009119_20010 [Algoriphagus jejuensis]|uniref:Phage envelope protein n=1 Tax=Algoriphagus jejuensis TaxID=419934 RepID=A0ABP3YDH6_9BACT